MDVVSFSLEFQQVLASRDISNEGEYDIFGNWTLISPMRLALPKELEEGPFHRQSDDLPVHE